MSPDSFCWKFFFIYFWTLLVLRNPKTRQKQIKQIKTKQVSTLLGALRQMYVAFSICFSHRRLLSAPKPKAQSMGIG
jgi:hypothetical protein